MADIEVTADPERFDEAIRQFRKRVPVPDHEWDALLESEREFAFKVSGAAEADLAAQAWESLDRAIRDGKTLEDFKADAGAELEAAWGGANPARLETIFRTNTLGAYNGGRHEILSHPEVKKARPYWRFDAVEDSRTSEICEPLDGTVLHADDSFWNAHTPPLHFNAIASDTEVATEFGPIQAAFLRPGMRVLTHARRWREVTESLHKLVRRTVLELHLASGRILRVTKEHPILVNATAHGLIWKQAGDIQPGDQVLEHGHQMLRSKDTVVVDADHAPALSNEPSIANQIVGSTASRPMVLPVYLDSDSLSNEGEIENVGTNRMLCNGSSAEEREEVLFSWSERATIGRGLGRGRASESGAVMAGIIGGQHSIAVPLHDSGTGSAKPERPMLGSASLLDDLGGTIRDSDLLSLGSNGHSVSLAPPGEGAIGEAVLSLDRTKAPPRHPMLGADDSRQVDFVAGVEWHSSTVITIVARQYFGEVCDFSVAEDETYVAGGVVVHNCRSVITPLSADEADDEGIDSSAPEGDADEGFGHSPTMGGEWEPDPSKYPPAIAEILEQRLR